MEGIGMTVWTIQVLVCLRMSAEDMVVYQEVVVPEFLRGLRVVADYQWVVANFELWKNYSEPHALSSSPSVFKLLYAIALSI